MHPALTAIANSTRGTSFDGDLYVVGGAVRDELLGLEHDADFDLVTRGSSSELAHLLRQKGISSIDPVTYERFGTAMVRVEDIDIEIVTARRESYDESSRKPTVEPASYTEDALRRDFTVNTLQRSIHGGELRDPTGLGLSDLRDRVLRTPLEPQATFFDDPLRMLRAVRFRWKLGFEPAPGIYDAIRAQAPRLAVISAERIRDEFVKMLVQPSASDALDDLMKLGLIAQFAPEFVSMVGCEQGSFHHLDVWDHTRLVVKNLAANDAISVLGALFHDVAKPATRFIDDQGNTRFFGHESVGAKMTVQILRRLKFPQRDIEIVSQLVRNHMRLGSSPIFSPTAARRLLRDMGDQTERLLDLVEADAASLHPGVRSLDLAPIRARLSEVAQVTPRERLQSPLSGEEIMAITGLPQGAEIGRIKDGLLEQVLEGKLSPDDKEGARAWVEGLGGIQ